MPSLPADLITVSLLIWAPQKVLTEPTAHPEHCSTSADEVQSSDHTTVRALHSLSFKFRSDAETLLLFLIDSVDEVI